VIAFIVVQVYDLRMKLKVLDLFSGIGGFSLGLEQTGGFETTQFVEQDPKAQLVLKKHWPNIPIHDDIRTYEPTPFSADVVCGGFPCQDISAAGRGVGIIGERSYLWKEMARVIGVVRPKWVVAENVSTLRSKGLALVLQDLSSLGYDAEWHCIPASAIGAPHERDRIWIIAHPNDSRNRTSKRGDMPKNREAILKGRQEYTLFKPSGYCEEVANSSSQQLRESTTKTSGEGQERKLHTPKESKAPHDLRCAATGCCCLRGESTQANFWAIESKIRRVAHGLPGRVDRLKQLGNAIVPQLATLIGYEILKKDIF